VPEASPSSSIYRTLDPARIRETLRRLGDRIAERFPGSGLSAVARDLTDLAERTEAEAKRIARPNVPLRIAMAVAIAVGLLGLGEIVWLLKPRVGEPEIFSPFQGAEAAISLIVIAGAGLFFAITMEDRLKRRQALRALHGIRSIVHVIDMHQLTKDPSVVLMPASPTKSSPTRTMSRYELTRYLDYCSEMLSLAGKLAALYAQSLPDPATISAVNDIEQLTANLSQKIWQKISIVENDERSLGPAPRGGHSAPG
jgi:hypothetical protein